MYSSSPDSSHSANFKSTLDWDVFLRRCAEWNAKSSTHLTLLVSQQLVAADVPQSVLDALRPADFDEHVVRWATNQIFTRSRESNDPMAISPRLATFWSTKSPLEKAKAVWGILFPALEEVRHTYNIPPHSLRAYVYYFVRFKDVLTQRGGPAWRLIRGEKRALTEAQIVGQLVDTPLRNR